MPIKPYFNSKFNLTIFLNNKCSACFQNLILTLLVLNLNNYKIIKIK